MSIAGSGVDGGSPFLLHSLIRCYSRHWYQPRCTANKHAMHEDHAVSHADPIECPGVDVMRVGAHNNVPECPVCHECYIWVAVEGIQVVLIVIYCRVEWSQAAELHLDNGMEAAK